MQADGLHRHALTCMAACLLGWLGLRVINIYNLNAKTYLLKLGGQSQ